MSCGVKYLIALGNMQCYIRLKVEGHAPWNGVSIQPTVVWYGFHSALGSTGDDKSAPIYSRICSSQYNTIVNQVHYSVWPRSRCFGSHFDVICLCLVAFLSNSHRHQANRIIINHPHRSSLASNLQKGGRKTFSKTNT